MPIPSLFYISRMPILLFFDLILGHLIKVYTVCISSSSVSSSTQFGQAYLSQYLESTMYKVD